jgi:cysteinyl-tRNA synthetase
MALRLYDTATHDKLELRPIDSANVRMYVCGPTVYDDAHIGNARPVIVFDLLFRLLRLRYGAEHVTYARNVTDVDDKINLRAAERGIDIRTLTDGTLARFQAAADGLGCLRPTVEPRATDHIEAMRAIIERLVSRGIAYVAEDHVLFSVGAMTTAKGAPRYGSLARRSLDEMLAGARVDVAPYKRDPMDFVLWKPSVPPQPGWPSPAGIATPGRPGWHIECSAMSMATLLEPFGGGLSCDDPAKNIFDIHGGGIDLVFPHHENEVAQSCCAFGTPAMAAIWMHNGFLQVEGQKMSKSLGNFITIDALLNSRSFGGRAWHGDVLRLAMLRTHYRQPIDWTAKALEEAQQTLLRWSEGNVLPAGEPDPEAIAALEDDLNTPAAIARLHQVEDDAVRARTLSLLGFGNDHGAIRTHDATVAGIDTAVSEVAKAELEALFAERLAARAARDFAASDRLRGEMEALGAVVKDSKEGSTWTWRDAP